jgi:hypothetical protein
MRWALVALALAGCDWPAPAPVPVECVMIIHEMNGRGRRAVETERRIVGQGVLEKGRIRCWLDKTSSP